MITSDAYAVTETLHKDAILLGVPLEIGRFLDLALRLAAALADIHAQGIVHKNIKIENDLTLPSSEELEILYDLGRRGDLRGIQKRATYLEELDPGLKPFAGKLRQLAKTLKLKLP